MYFKLRKPDLHALAAGSGEVGYVLSERARQDEAFAEAGFHGVSSAGPNENTLPTYASSTLNGVRGPSTSWLGGRKWRKPSRLRSATMARSASRSTCRANARPYSHTIKATRPL